MLPSLLRISLSPAVPRSLMALALFATLLVSVLGLLVGATKRAVLGLVAASIALAVLLAARTQPQTAFVLEVSSFGASLGLSLGIGGAWLFWSARRAGLSAERVAVRVSWLLVGGLLGARLGHWLMLDAGSTSWRGLANFQRGGLFGFGAYLGGLLATLWVFRNDQRGLASWLDQLSAPVRRGAGVVRIGCYFDGSSFGRPLRPGAHPALMALGTFPRWDASPGERFLGSPAWANHVSHWGLSPDAPVSLPVHPVQLYEAAFAFALLLLTFAIRRRVQRVGLLFLSVAIAYAIGYFLFGFLRGDSTPTVLLVSKRLNWVIPLGSHEQLTALGVCTLALLAWPRWKNEQALLARVAPFFRAAKARIANR